MNQHPDIIVSVDLGTTFTGNHPEKPQICLVDNKIRRSMENASHTTPNHQRLAR